MATINKRLDDLERRFSPPKDPTWICIECEDNGVKWMTKREAIKINFRGLADAGQESPPIDYRDCFDPDSPNCVIITEDEYKALEQAHNIFLIVYQDIDAGTAPPPSGFS